MKVITPEAGNQVKVQLLQTLSILIQNLKSEVSLCKQDKNKTKNKKP
jgi:hypothetical protein